MKRIYDVAVVGAGPAGTMFVRELTKKCPELSVVLIDGQNEHMKKPCGGLLAPDAQKVLAQFDMTLPNDILADPQIFTVKTMDIEVGCTRYYQRHYLNMDRFKFDKWLLSGVPVSVRVLSSRVNDIKREDVFCLTVGDGEIYARAVVGADGAGSVVRRKLYGRMPKQYISIQEWYEGGEEGMPYYSCIFDKITSDSCSWTVHKNGALIFGGAFERKGCRETFETQKARFERFCGVSFGAAVKREACLLTSPRHMSDLVCGGKGFYLLGEAAGFISASSYEGISSAMISARCLAEAFGKARRDSDILRLYKRKTLPLRIKLVGKMIKRALLCQPILRGLIMKSGICSVKVDKK